MDVPHGSDGVVLGIRRFPVKSFAPVPLEAADITESGLAYDRVSALIDVHGRALNGKRASILSQVHARVCVENGEEYIGIDAGNGEYVRLESAEAIAYLNNLVGEKFAGTFTAELLDVPKPDKAQVSLVSGATIDAIARGTGDSTVDIERFRMNLHVRWAGNMNHPFFEHGLVGRDLYVGDGVRLHVEEAAKRCALMNVDPDTQSKNPAVHRWMIDHSNSCAGIYLRVVERGRISIGDKIRID